MKEIQTQIIIHASPEKIWNILMDFDYYPDWNPFIKNLSGEQKIGHQLIAFIQPPGDKGMTFKPVVREVKVNQEFRWLGKLWGGGFFNGEHYFLLNKLDDHSTQFIHGEKFTGILVGVLSSMLKNTKNGFEAMNGALKAKAEAKG